jgi:exodeoxyribonuclease V alpha subunit
VELLSSALLNQPRWNRCAVWATTQGHREETTVVESLPAVTAGEWLVADGSWIRDKEHGLQFKAAMMKTVPPTTPEGIERYLGSGLVKGIGSSGHHREPNR